MLPDSRSLQQVGQIELARFINPGGLRKMQGNLYAETDASGPPTVGSPEVAGLGKIRQHALEASNVDLETERLEFGRTRQTLGEIRELLREMQRK